MSSTPQQPPSKVTTVKSSSIDAQASGVVAPRAAVSRLEGKVISLETTRLCVFIYGENGTGKTWLAASLPGSYCFINYAGNPESLHKLVKKEGGTPRYTAVEGPTDWEGASTMFRDPFLDRFDNIVLDNATGLNRVLVTGATKIPAKEGARISGEQPILRDYGIAAERLRVIITSMKKDRKPTQNLIVIAHTKQDYNEEGQVISAGPSVPGGVPAHILSLFGEQIYLRVGADGKRVAHYKQYKLYGGATRLLEKDEPVVDPNLAVIYKDYLRSALQRS